MDEMVMLKQRMLRLTAELISDCPYCASISDNVQTKSPIHCTKWSGSSFPVRVNQATCLSCGEYRKMKSTN
jgi:hypothetical protein